VALLRHARNVVSDPMPRKSSDSLALILKAFAFGKACLQRPFG